MPAIVSADDLFVQLATLAPGSYRVEAVVPDQGVADGIEAVSPNSAVASPGPSLSGKEVRSPGLDTRLQVTPPPSSFLVACHWRQHIGEDESAPAVTGVFKQPTSSDPLESLLVGDVTGSSNIVGISLILYAFPT